MKNLKLQMAAVRMVLAVAWLLCSGCASVLNGYATTHEDARVRPAEAGFRVTAFDPAVGGPSVQADVGEIVSNLWNHHPWATVSCATVDVGTFLFVAYKQTWFPFHHNTISATANTSASVAHDIITIKGNNNTVDASTGHVTVDVSAR